jgi:hypothetical protein
MTDKNLMIVSSDGHATRRLVDFRPGARRSFTRSSTRMLADEKLRVT